MRAFLAAALVALALVSSANAAQQRPLANINGEVRPLPSGDTLAPSTLGGPWTDYTPTLSANSGTFTAATPTGNYTVIGKTVFSNTKLAITTNGSAAGYILIGLPLPSRSLIGCNAPENGALFVSLKAIVGPGSSQIIVTTQSGGYPGADGGLFVVSCFYETP